MVSSNLFFKQLEHEEKVENNPQGLYRRALTLWHQTRITFPQSKTHKENRTQTESPSCPRKLCSCVELTTENMWVGH